MDKHKIKLLLQLPLTELISRANRIRSQNAGSEIELCNIMNAKSGMCGEDCKFCAQSVHHKTDISAYSLKSKAEILKSAKCAKDMGAHRFDIVTSGNVLGAADFKKIIEAVSEIRSKIGIKMCASLGKLNEDSLAMLKKAGVSRYHHNIETSPGYFPMIVKTHTFQDRIDTIKAAKKVGLEVCSGGIIGMGEDWDDRIDMALILKRLKVDSVPLNILMPIKGTSFENFTPLSSSDIIRTIAIFRIILKDKIIKVAAGRESILKDFQSMAFMAGANGMLIGGYLTLKGRAVVDDLRLADEVKKAW
ncbi:MAG: biotin synthase BioB [Candidatus Omnitrophica bacterium]|jgi:biotin synthase|nr:biotin synthase BioB [Candidatus Omnitrophota bacterium]